MLRWFLQCQIDPIRSISVSYCWQRRYSALLAVWFKQLGCCCVLSRETRLRHKKKWVHECWESVYNILPSAALLYVDTCFKMWCISLYLPVLNTLCSSPSVFFPVWLIMMKWLWMSCPILISLTYWLFILPFCITGHPLGPCPSPLAHPRIFLYFDTIFDYVYCPSYSELVKAF